MNIRINIKFLVSVLLLKMRIVQKLVLHWIFPKNAIAANLYRLGNLHFDRKWYLSATAILSISINITKFFDRWLLLEIDHLRALSNKYL